MNLGKMGIQICEKLREKPGWRQIASCHKWDEELAIVPSGNQSYMHTAHDLSIKSKTLLRLLLRDTSMKHVMSCSSFDSKLVSRHSNLLLD